MTLLSVITTDNAEILGSVVYIHGGTPTALENDNALTLTEALWIRYEDEDGKMEKFSSLQDFREPRLKNTITLFTHNIKAVISVTDKRVIDEYNRIVKEYQNDE